MITLESKALGYKKEIIKSIQEFVRIKSVEEEPKMGMPFGEGPAKALKYILDLAEKLGFKTVNFNNYIGHIEFGEGSDDDILGILGHVDVVPEGEGWIYPPYEGKVIDGKIYGRGVADNKGPIITVLYALKALKDFGLIPKRKIRFIVGANEETDWRCVKYYFEKLKMPQPSIAFVPDAVFPVINYEKGSLHIVLEKEYISETGFSLEGGIAFNSVPERATCIIHDLKAGGVIDRLNEYNRTREYKISIGQIENKLQIISYGKASHGSLPQNGHNAISALFEFLSILDIEDKNISDLVKFFRTNIGMGYFGERLGLNFDDGMGKLTLNVGKAVINPKEGIKLELDIRYPAGIKKDKVVEKIAKVAKKNNLKVRVHSDKRALYVPEDNFLVKKLMMVYRKVTGDIEGGPLAIGGATYAKVLTNGVAFGPGLKGKQSNVHQANECIELASIDIWLKIYTAAIYELSQDVG